MRLIYLYLLLLSCLSTSAQAFDYVSNVSTDGELNAVTASKFLRDPGCQGRDWAKHAFDTGMFADLPTHAQTFGFTPDCIWVALELDANIEAPLFLRVLGGKPSNIEQYVYFDDQLYAQRFSGFSLAPENRAIPSQGILLPLNNYSEGSLHLLKISSNTPLYFRFLVGPPTLVDYRFETKHLLTLILLGIVVASALNYGLFYLALRRKEFLYFIAYTSMFVVTLSVQFGLFEVLFNASKETSEWIGQVSVPLTYLFFGLFTLHILEIKPRLPAYASRIFMVVILLGMISNSLPFFVSPEFGPVVSALFMAILLSAGVLAICVVIKGSISARLYLMGIIGVLITFTAFGLLVSPGFEYTFWKQNSIVIGSIWEILMFSAVLTYRVRSIQKQKQIAEHSASTDDLTGLPNRREFFKRGRHIVGDLPKYQPASLIMLDIDHFKLVNDTYGHDGGDEALRQFADRINTVLRSQDTFSRIGGEEFALLLPHTDTAQAIKIATRICNTIRRNSVPFGQREIRFTVSAGITSFLPEERSLEDVMIRADEALYKAKQNGRDRWELLPQPDSTQSSVVPQ